MGRGRREGFGWYRGHAAGNGKEWGEELEGAGENSEVVNNTRKQYTPPLTASLATLATGDLQLRTRPWEPQGIRALGIALGEHEHKEEAEGDVPGVRQCDVVQRRHT